MIAHAVLIGDSINFQPHILVLKSEKVCEDPKKWPFPRQGPQITVFIKVESDFIKIISLVRDKGVKTILNFPYFEVIMNLKKVEHFSGQEIKAI